MIIKNSNRLLRIEAIVTVRSVIDFSSHADTFGHWVCHVPKYEYFTAVMYDLRLREANKRDINTCENTEMIENSWITCYFTSVSILLFLFFSLDFYFVFLKQSSDSVYSHFIFREELCDGWWDFEGVTKT